MINPNSPEWFQEALAVEPETFSIEVEGAKISYLAWGKKENPGILFVHGGMAHAHWWSFIAPFFAETHRVIAMNLSGMGDSEWREDYASELWGKEIVEVAKHEKLTKPIIVGHSLGGMCSVVAAFQFKKDLYGLVIVDTAIMPPSKIPDKFDFKIKANKTYKSIEDAKARFRLVPSQGGSLDFIMDYIADKSLKQVEDGWSWKFDPKYMSIFTTEGFKARQAILSDKLVALDCRVAVLRGEKSMLFPESAGKYMHELTNKKMPIIAIPEAHHHIMVDQPLALVAALRALVTDWDHSVPAKAE
ncbi:MAG: alpha/beta fold hydrolase [Candidatus Pelagibacterales bacterium]|jgi:pimeloyl-ACP methyl ester carboxylesterase|tara:strand:+ start:190 stop:1095 length:906 start_codon:yes stop_codon:yes gene_type:complete